MKYWNVEYSEEAAKDRDTLSSSAKNQVYKAIRKVSQNPLPKSEGGYGNPLGSQQGSNLTGLFKIKLLKLGIRVVYKLIRTDEIMKIVIIAARADDEVYRTATKRVEKER
jgi:mRNA interferase RelE/StbE